MKTDEGFTRSDYGVPRNSTPSIIPRGDVQSAKDIFGLLKSVIGMQP